jgi:DNA polymerase-3 subunit gamma/tau
MSYKVLARKFRPGSFDEVVGQDPIVRTLRNAIEGDRLAHAYLFSGPRGVGKTTLARIVAKSLNCGKAEAPTVASCNECEACVEIAESRSLDVHEIDGASNRGIDDIRELRETSRYQPSRDRFRVFIIDEVHMLTREAFNALLKILEEPPPHVVFVFATTEYQKVPATITSRCQHFEFRRIERSQLAGTLARVAEAEEIKLTERGADLLARTASGSLRDALGYLDLALAYCGAEVTDADLREVLGVAGLEVVDSFFDGLASRDATALTALVDRAARAGQDLGHLCRELVERGRELLLLRSTKEARAVLGMTEAEEAEARKLAERFAPEELLRVATALTELEGKLRFSSNARFLLEMTALRLARTAPVVPIEDLVARLEALSGAAPRAAGPPVNEGGGSAGPGPRPRKSGGGAAPPRRDAAPKVTAPPNPSPEAASEPGPEAALAPVAADSKEEEIRRRVAGKRSALGSYLEHASALRIESEKLVIRFPARHALFRNGLARADNRMIVEEAAREATGRDLTIDVGISEEADSEMGSLTEEAARVARRDSLMSKALAEPIVKTVMDRFRASVVRIEESNEP